MFVSKLTLINTRSYSKMDLNLSPSINILVGNNNSGKSTIIKALYKLQNAGSLGLEDVRKTQDSARVFIDLEDITNAEGVTFQLNNKENPSKFPDTTRVKVVFGIYDSLRDTQKGQESLFFDLNLPWELDEGGKFIIVGPDGQEVPFINFNGFPNLETHHNFIYPFFAKRKTGFYNNQLGEREAYTVSEDLRNITSKVQKISNPSHPKNKQFIKQIEDILGFSIGVIPHGENQSNTGIFVGDNTVIPIERMGEGIVNIVGLIVMLLTEDRKLYLIEELENDIHPKALKKLLELIIEKSANNQFVISTHSNIVLKYLGVKNSKLFRLLWQPFEKTPEDRLPTSVISELDKDPEAKMKLLEELGYDLFDFDLFKSYLIFEESSAESLVRDFLLPVFFPSLTDKVKTLAASGADDLVPRFHDFLRLFVFIHQNPIYASRAWVFADGDDAGKANIQQLRTSFPSWEPEHFINFSKDNIEEYYPVRFQIEFMEINSTSDKRQKREAKRIFTKKIQGWIASNPAEAKTEFNESAAEILDFLKIIEPKINSDLK